MKYSDTGKLANGQFSPDMLPDYLKEHKFQITVWCMKHGYPWIECDYKYVNYNGKTIDEVAECPKCHHKTAIGIEV